MGKQTKFSVFHAKLSVFVCVFRAKLSIFVCAFHANMQAIEIACLTKTSLSIFGESFSEIEIKILILLFLQSSSRYLKFNEKLPRLL